MPKIITENYITDTCINFSTTRFSGNLTVLLAGLSTILIGAAALALLAFLTLAPETPLPGITESLPLITPGKPTINPEEETILLCWKFAVISAAILTGWHALMLAGSIAKQNPIERHWIEYPILLLTVFIYTIGTVFCRHLTAAYFGNFAEITLQITNLTTAAAILAAAAFLLLIIRDIANCIMEGLNYAEET